MEFKRPETGDIHWVRELVNLSDFHGCEYAFGNSYMWSYVYDIQIARYKDFYLSKNKFGFLFPAGCGNLRELICVLQEYCCRENKPLRFTNVDCKSLELLRCLYESNCLKVSTNRDMYDYVYEFEALSELRGKKLHAKRNHLNRFYENNWSFEPITPENIEEVTDMHNRWCEEKEIYNDIDKLREAGAVIRGLERFFELGFIGGAIRVDGEIQGYTFGEVMGNKSNDMFVVHVEKAFTTFQGTYAAINREFVNYACRDYRYINREEDAGSENLRKAKMSYCPAFLVEKSQVEIL
ncbi:MAG: phosphatidylglycerol lysyltransferase domain-containing protein [Oscillospiraceae bacterium]|nr:phosphatidylglycerol lysyltransferase domain-containing protein [Oscillospiraceae bacterium]